MVGHVRAARARARVLRGLLLQQKGGCESMSKDQAQTIEPQGQAEDFFRYGIVFNGDAFMEATEAKVSIYDHSFLYGDGVFEVLACHDGQPFAVDAHLERLWLSCRVVSIDPPVSRSRMRELITEVIDRNDLRSGQIRVVISRGEGYPRADPREARRSHLVILTEEKPASTYHGYGTRGLRLVIASTRRTPPVALDPRIKSNNYLNHIMAKLEGIAAGADDVVMLDIEGRIAETPGGNVFSFRAGTLATPEPINILAGITRRMILDLSQQGVAGRIEKVEERAMTPYDLYTAEEVFIVGTGCGIAFVSEIDGRSIGDGGPGAVTAALKNAYEGLLGRPD